MPRKHPKEAPRSEPSDQNDQEPTTRKLRGRPPLAPKTALARWIQSQGLTATDFVRDLQELAPSVERQIRLQYPEFKLTADDIPTPKNLLDAANGRHRPRLLTVLLVAVRTEGEIGPAEWVADMSRHGLT